MLIEDIKKYNNMENNIDELLKYFDTIEQIQTEECSICFYEKPINEYVMLDCNNSHKVCISCYSKLDKCPFCLKKIKVTPIQPQIITINSAPSIDYRVEQRFRNRYNEIIVDLLCKFTCGIVCVFIIFLFVYMISSSVTNKDK